MAKTIQQIVEGAAMDCHKLLKSKGWKPVGKGEYGGTDYAKGTHIIGTDYHGARWWHGTEDAKAPVTAVGYNHHDLARHLQKSGLNEQLGEDLGILPYMAGAGALGAGLGAVAYHRIAGAVDEYKKGQHQKKVRAKERQEMHDHLISRGFKHAGTEKNSPEISHYEKGDHVITLAAGHWYHMPPEPVDGKLPKGKGIHSLRRHTANNGLNEQLDEETGSVHDYLKSKGWKVLSGNDDGTIYHRPSTPGHDGHVAVIGNDWQHFTIGHGSDKLHAHLSKLGLNEQLEEETEYAAGIHDYLTSRGWRHVQDEGPGQGTWDNPAEYYKGHKDAHAVIVAGNEWEHFTPHADSHRGLYNPTGTGKASLHKQLQKWTRAELQKNVERHAID